MIELLLNPTVWFPAAILLAAAVVAATRRRLDAAAAMHSDEIVFTSGGTEANNLAIHGVAEALDGTTHLVTTVIEHPATARPVVGWSGTDGASPGSASTETAASTWPQRATRSTAVRGSSR
jgi:cysteine sulfinate desulfinase/cysteine desulfurase-like protein